MTSPELWEPFTPTRAVQRKEVLGWFNIVRLLGRPVPAVDASATDFVPVLLVPGFLSGDWGMVPMARDLRRAGYPTLTSGIAFNSGCSEALLNGLEQRLSEAVEQVGRPVALVGQSRGGTLARMLAAKRPELVAGLITLGSPLLHQLATTRMVIRQVDVLTKLNVRDWPWLISADCVAGGCAERTNALLAAPLPDGMPFTSIYSRFDGVVDWRACLDPAAEQVEVRSAHNGMGADPAVRRWILSRLAAL